MAKKFPRFKAGEQFGLRGRNGEFTLDKRAADLLNSAAEEMKRLGRVSVTPPLRWTETADGRKFACDFNPEIMVKLSGSGNPYSFVQQQYDPATNTWSNMAGGRTGTSNCYGRAGSRGRWCRLPTCLPRMIGGSAMRELLIAAQRRSSFQRAGF